MTNREKVVVMAYTGFCTLKGDKLDLYYQYLEELFGRPVYTHEIPSLLEEIQEKAKPEFIQICQKEEEEKKEETHEWYYQICIQLDDPLKCDYKLPYHFKSYQKALVVVREKDLLGKAYIILVKD